VNTMFILGFRFCFESSSTFFVKVARFISLLSVVSRKLCCLCYVEQVGNGRNGWPRALQGCKGEEKETWLDKNKNGSSKEKDRSIFGENYGNLSSR